MESEPIIIKNSNIMWVSLALLWEEMYNFVTKWEKHGHVERL